MQILLSGDALQTNVVTVELEVESGVRRAKVTETDCAVDALLWRQTQITLTPFLLSGNFTVLSGPTLQMSRFLDENVYIQPDRHFRGIVKVPTENIAKEKAPLPSRKDKIRGHLRRLLDENESSRRNAALQMSCFFSTQTWRSNPIATTFEASSMSRQKATQEGGRDREDTSESSKLEVGN